jgi:hypothetical protein
MPPWAIAHTDRYPSILAHVNVLTSIPFPGPVSSHSPFFHTVRIRAGVAPPHGVVKRSPRAETIPGGGSHHTNWASARVTPMLLPGVPFMLFTKL